MARLEEALVAARRFWAYAWLGEWPFRFVREASEYRQLAQAIGDVEEARRWKTIYDRHAAILADREKVIAFMLWWRR